MKRLKKKSEPRRKMINLDISALSNATIRNNFCENIAQRLGDNPEYEPLSDTVKTVCQETLPKKTKSQPGWFQANSAKLLSLIQSRNQAMKNDYPLNQKPTSLS